MVFKRCPFCGGKGRMTTDSGGFKVCCEKCFASAQLSVDQESASNAWNKRNYEWISTHERLPDCVKDHGFSKVVWCLDAHGKTGFGIYQKELRHEGWFTGGEVGENSVIITHWMPLPALPEEVES